MLAAGALLRARPRGLGVRRHRGRDGRTVSSLFVDLFPNVLMSSTDAAYSLTVSGAASGSYALKVMTVAAAIFVPLVLLYQGWTYRVFRARVHDSSAATPDFAVPAGHDGPKRGWSPRLSDYLYVALTNAIAVSPTDTMPLTRRAKGLMAVESLISYAVVLLVVVPGGERPGL